MCGVVIKATMLPGESGMVSGKLGVVSGELGVVKGCEYGAKMFEDGNKVGNRILLLNSLYMQRKPTVFLQVN